MKLFFLFSFFIFINSTFACVVSITPTVIIIGEGLTEDSFSIDCQNQTKTSVNGFFSSAKGLIKTTTITALLENESLVFNQTEINIINFKDLLLEKTQVNSNKISSYSIPNAPKVIKLENSQTYSITALESSTQGDKFKFNIYENNLLKWTYDGVVNIEKSVKAYTAVKAFPAFSNSVRSNSLIEVEVSPDSIHEYFTDIDKLAYFETNKPIKENRPLRKSDFNPINIVRAGNTVEAQLENNNIKVKFQVVSRNNGGLGDRVEVYNPKTNLKYNSKIIDFNKVVIEL
jgi:flagella basal body P-ring formation protein FlgA